MRHRAIFAAVFLVPVLAAASPADRPEQSPDEVLRDYLDRVAPVDPAAPASRALSEDGQAEATEGVKQALLSVAVDEQAANPAGTAAAAGFADRVNATLQNFLPLFQGAIDAVSTGEDGKTVTLRLNPIRAATFGELGLSVSATEPEPSEALLKLLPDDARPGQKEAIQKTLDDFTDLTYAATYNYVRKLEPQHVDGTSARRWFFGRNPRLYEEVFAHFVGDTLTLFLPGNNAALDPFLDRFEEGVDFEGLTRTELEAALGAADYQRLVEIMVGRREPLAALNARAGQRARLFGELAGNQPQATLSGLYRERDPLVGRNETSFNLSIEMPAAPNINELLRSWRRTGDWQRALDDLDARKEEIEAGTKWSVAASYKEAEPYQVRYQPTTEGAAAVGLDRPRSRELSVKLQYTRNATWQRLTVDGSETFPALHVSAELLDVSDDPDREDRRIVGTITYDVPVRKGVSFPISLVYANRSELLGDPDHQFSAHFGLNLNALTGRSGN